MSVVLRDENLRSFLRKLIIEQAGDDAVVDSQDNDVAGDSQDNDVAGDSQDAPSLSDFEFKGKNYKITMNNKPNGIDLLSRGSLNPYVIDLTKTAKGSENIKLSRALKLEAYFSTKGPISIGERILDKNWDMIKNTDDENMGEDGTKKGFTNYPVIDIYLDKTGEDSVTNTDNVSDLNKEYIKGIILKILIKIINTIKSSASNNSPESANLISALGKTDNTDQRYRESFEYINDLIANDKISLDHALRIYYFLGNPYLLEYVRDQHYPPEGKVSTTLIMPAESTLGLTAPRFWRDIVYLAPLERIESHIDFKLNDRLNNIKKLSKNKKLSQDKKDIYIRSAINYFLETFLVFFKKVIEAAGEDADEDFKNKFEEVKNIKNEQKLLINNANNVIAYSIKSSMKKQRNYSVAIQNAKMSLRNKTIRNLFKRSFPKIEPTHLGFIFCLCVYDNESELKEIYWLKSKLLEKSKLVSDPNLGKFTAANKELFNELFGEIREGIFLKIILAKTDSKIDFYLKALNEIKTELIEKEISITGDGRINKDDVALVSEVNNSIKAALDKAGLTINIDKVDSTRKIIFKKAEQEIKDNLRILDSNLSDFEKLKNVDGFENFYYEEFDEYTAFIRNKIMQIITLTNNHPDDYKQIEYETRYKETFKNFVNLAKKYLRTIDDEEEITDISKLINDTIKYAGLDDVEEINIQRTEAISSTEEAKNKIENEITFIEEAIDSIDSEDKLSSIYEDVRDIAALINKLNLDENVKSNLKTLLCEKISQLIAKMKTMGYHTKPDSIKHSMKIADCEIEVKEPAPQPSVEQPPTPKQIGLFDSQPPTTQSQNDQGYTEELISIENYDNEVLLEKYIENTSAIELITSWTNLIKIKDEIKNSPEDVKRMCGILQRINVLIQGISNNQERIDKNIVQKVKENLLLIKNVILDLNNSLDCSTEEAAGDSQAQPVQISPAEEIVEDKPRTTVRIAQRRKPAMRWGGDSEGDFQFRFMKGCPLIRKVRSVGFYPWTYAGAYVNKLSEEQKDEFYEFIKSSFIEKYGEQKWEEIKYKKCNNPEHKHTESTPFTFGNPKFNPQQSTPEEKNNNQLEEIIRRALLIRS